MKKPGFSSCFCDVDMGDISQNPARWWDMISNKNANLLGPAPKKSNSSQWENEIYTTILRKTT